MTTTADKLREAKALIEDPERWCQNHYALDADGNSVRMLGQKAVRWCAIGACVRVGLDMDVLYDIVLPDKPLSEINDDDGHAAVMALFDRAIELAASEESGDG